ncbi:hypothetical protein KIK06_24835 [Nocardiopsis sp. EMB25]|uniref:hypothetical protein n=1 Tax=Nocardiopsis sp. EMB25 TaxID=2835867 RepID=UPI002283EFCB|nr:hypothetical protein [Nocardiopsis sp. EMB25]MCY9787115.1 hypothetical protein [Nocardiopsis sp. EMB25]
MDRAWNLFTAGGQEDTPVAEFGGSRLGWCVDDDGVRAVRPYLVAHEQQQRERSRGEKPRAPHMKRGVRNHLTEGENQDTSGEWSELAGLIRQWEAMRAPVS